MVTQLDEAKAGLLKEAAELARASRGADGDGDGSGDDGGDVGDRNGGGGAQGTPPHPQLARFQRNMPSGWVMWPSDR